jgi:hypothetical protein
VEVFFEKNQIWSNVIVASPVRLDKEELTVVAE